MIYLCRHGQTAFNREHRLQGRMESDLTPLGRAQAGAMADLLHDLIARDQVQPWRIVASPLRRARDTAGIIGAKLGLPVEFDDRLMELTVGEWEGRLRAEVAREHPELFTDRTWFFAAPGGETYDQVMARVSDWLSEQAAEPERRLIVVSHGIAGRLLRGAYAGLSPAEVLELDVPQDALYRLHAGQLDRFDCEPVEDPEHAAELVKDAV
ncbi:phosphoglycerate kinase [Caulobacter sp. Root1455]|uniref:histidine phosphatase family protein n=1 Tax=unclassified Caulobacter TaxID=2648921 RepID=UPI0006F5D6E4|nr:MULTISPECIES: histidine phosphatase family protein [unclassified Caulobacter]KQY30051.1 phosphoglycerate kinase [Caulobacter sp. Root487D2Y]KQY92845.1 phosphoglycerate kinase [Caulobacter sp. Root1455]